MEKEEEDKEEKVKHRRNFWCTKRKEQFVNFLVSERKEEDLEKKAERGVRVPGRNNFWEDLEGGSSFS